jgi:hypothetical protein
MNHRLPIIEKFIIKHYPDVMDVYFTEMRVFLAGSTELPFNERTITRTVINIVINNLKNNLPNRSQKNELISNINDRLSGFGVDQFEYGSKWGTQYHIAEIKKYE